MINVKCPECGNYGMEEYEEEDSIGSKFDTVKEYLEYNEHYPAIKATVIESSDIVINSLESTSSDIFILPQTGDTKVLCLFCPKCQYFKEFVRTYE